MLVLAADTGHRISAILGLEQGDWNPEDQMFGSITWRAELDKVGKGHTVAVTRRVREAVQTQLQRWPESEHLFPAPAREGPVRTDVASEWLRDLEDEAEGVEHVPGRLWHGFRRQWVTRRKGRFPRSDIAKVGGWTSEATLDRYEQPDEETTQDVVLERERGMRGMEEAG